MAVLLTSKRIGQPGDQACEALCLQSTDIMMKQLRQALSHETKLWEWLCQLSKVGVPIPCAPSNVSVT